jgi:toxin ParE1/3/4
MAHYTLSRAAERDIASILTWTHDHFGESARRRYEELIVQAIIDVADDPERPGSAARNEVSRGARTYHLGHSRNRVAISRGRVRRPRHFLLYRATDKNRIEIGRVLHDSMDLAVHLPPEYRSAPGDSH